MKKNIRIMLITIFIFIVIFFIFFKFKNQLLKLVYPIEFEDYVIQASEEFDIDKYLIFATIKAESNFESDVESSKGAKGLMQIMDSTAEDIANMLELDVEEIDLFDPETSITLGTKYLSILMEKYECIELALAAYNAGSGNVDSWISEGTLDSDGSNIENIPYKETNNYVRKILRDYEIYKNLYENV